MPRGRTQREAVIRQAVSGVEALEKRQMLTTMTGGQSYDYYDAEDNRVRITLTGDITAEATFARVRPDNTIVFRDLVPPPAGTGTGTTDGADLYNLYIASASPDATITISTYTATTNDIIFNPYGGSTDLRVVNAKTGRIFTTSSDGGVWIGARTRPITGQANSGNVPIIADRRAGRALGVRPASRALIAGIQTADGVSMDKVLVGGAVSGIVYMGGNVGTFYANNILTGDATGISQQFNTQSLGNNFFVGGDLRNFVVGDDVGMLEDIAANGDVTYRTGFDMYVSGRLGNVSVGGDFLGSVQVNNSSTNALNTPSTELEYTLQTGEDAGDAFVSGDLVIPEVQNDTETQLQYGYSTASPLSGETGALDFSGEINVENGDVADNYGVPLIAGQTVTVLLSNGIGINVGVYDPLGRLVATDLSDNGGGGVGEQFRFTAETAGVYRFVVGETGQFVEDLVVQTLSEYDLIIQGYGNVSLGGMRVEGDTLIGDILGQGLGVRTGDLGAIDSTGAFYADIGSTVAALRGNLRAFYAGDIGGTSIQRELAPDLVVPRGSVGYVRSDDLLKLNPSAIDITGDYVPAAAIGFDYQRVEGQAVNANLVANRAIGAIIADSIPAAPVIVANADRRGNDGTIDLIDVTGNFGSTITGGPGLYTGPGGNVKYIRTGGTVFPDRAFTSSLTAIVNGDEGETLTFTDDSGTQGFLIPTPVSTTTTGGTTGPITTIDRGILTATVYGVRDSAGVVVTNVTTTTGLTVNSGSREGTFDVSEIQVGNVSTATEFNPDTNIIGYEPPIATGEGEPGTTAVTVSSPAVRNDITFGGRAPVNVLSVTHIDPVVNRASISSLINTTAGEIVEINAQTVGRIQAQSLGQFKSSIDGAITPVNNIESGTAYPFDPYSYGVSITNPVISIESRENIGALYVTGNAIKPGAVGQITANSDGKGARGIFEGITGPVAAEVIRNINVGEGLASAGTGAINRGGIFAIESINSAQARIGTIVANNADLRGAIGSEGAIENITVQNGSINGAKIYTVSEIDQLSFVNRSGLVLNDQETEDVPGTGGVDDGNGGTTEPTQRLAYSIGSIVVSGNGGIINSVIQGGDFESIVANRGSFGILGSIIGSTATFNPSGTVAASGLGIRNTRIDAGTSLNQVVATGTGEVLNLNTYDASTRYSASGRFDPETGRWLDETNDLYKIVGTTRRAPAVSGITNAGIIEDSTIQGQGTLGSISGYLFRDGVDNLITPDAQSGFPNQISFANRTGTITATNGISGLRVTTGRLDKLLTGTLGERRGGNVEDFNLETTGDIGTVRINGILRANANIFAKGQRTGIESIFVKRGLFGTVTTNQSIGAADLGSLGGTLAASGEIEAFTVRSDVLTGAVGRGASRIGRLVIGGDVQEGAEISSNQIDEVFVGGVVNGEIIGND